MKYKNLTYITVFLLGGVTTLSAITLKESINLAIENNPNILYMEMKKILQKKYTVK